MVSKSLSTSQCFARLHDVAGKMAEFCQSLYPLVMAHSDDFGRLQGDPFTVKHACHPTSPRKVREFGLALQHLDDVGLIRWYEVEGQAIIEILKFYEHQTGLSKRTKSKFPACPDGNEELPKISHDFKGIPSELKGTELNRTELKELGPQAATPAPTKALLTLFDELHQREIGLKAHIVGNRDAAILANLVKARGAPEVETLIRAFFAARDPWVREHGGFTVPVFQGQIGKLIAQRPRAVAPVERWYDECQRVHADAPCGNRTAHELVMAKAEAS